ncbi:class I SAM-dependent methyltransferase [Jeotgalicoccus sp. WY2]|uniref:class I SAM-dependent methyltransferase n=1 Tax=Jeotgalicoccus sp. WY2 TaxID=2708346 RepID=UPI001BD51503|nr:class I SAM-dependent methyltransferase [Jeotgalicoccus sp. WY2]
MIVTTSGRYNEHALQKAKDIAMRYDLYFVMRKKLSVKEIKERYIDDVLVVGNDEMSITRLSDNDPVKYHPNFSMVRAKRLLNNDNDALVDAAELKPGMSFLDCTMGLAADSVIASLTVGTSGQVTALEQSFILYLLAKEGLASYDTNIKMLNDAMRAIETVHQNHTDYLEKLPDNSFDIVYFDPMFDEEINDSQSLRLITEVTHTEILSQKTIDEAKRVAAKKIVLKDHFRSSRFEQFGFMQQVRKTSKVHYGIIRTDFEVD